MELVSEVGCVFTVFYCVLCYISGAPVTPRLWGWALAVEWDGREHGWDEAATLGGLCEDGGAQPGHKTGEGPGRTWVGLASRCSSGCGRRVLYAGMLLSSVALCFVLFRLHAVSVCCRRSRLVIGRVKREVNLFVVL